MIWRDVKGYEGLYMVSDTGLIKSLSLRKNKPEYIKKPSKNKCGYMHTSLIKNGVQKDVRVHRLVAEAFVPNPNRYKEVNHIDEDKTNNCAANLEWCSRLYNVTYGSQKRKRRKVFQYTLGGKFIAEHDGWKDAENNTGIDSRRIFDAAHRKNGTAHGYMWRYE
jgi:hypothetical protein